jgi:hypothetical protein
MGNPHAARFGKPPSSANFGDRKMRHLQLRTCKNIARLPATAPFPVTTNNALRGQKGLSICPQCAPKRLCSARCLGDDQEVNSWCAHG